MSQRAHSGRGTGLRLMDVGANNPDTLYGTPNVDRLAASEMRGQVPFPVYK